VHQQTLFRASESSMLLCDVSCRSFTRSPSISAVCRSLGFKRPLPVQSMYIFKQPNIGGEVVSRCRPPRQPPRPQACLAQAQSNMVVLLVVTHVAYCESIGTNCPFVACVKICTVNDVPSWVGLCNACKLARRGPGLWVTCCAAAGGKTAPSLLCTSCTYSYITHAGVTQPAVACVHSAAGAPPGQHLPLH
jgi:hypothetical protein